MELRSAAEALKAVAEQSENRSKIGRLRGVLKEVEDAQKAGVKNSKIVETLNANGFELTIKTFETMLYRIRKERSGNSNIPSKPEGNQPPTTNQEESHKPEDQQLDNAPPAIQEANPQDGVSEVHKILTQPIVKYPPRKK